MLQVKNRFPDLDSLVESKLLLPHEAERLQRVDFTTPHEATWTPILWALKLVCKARSVQALSLYQSLTLCYRERGEVTLEPPVYADLGDIFSMFTELKIK